VKPTMFAIKDLNADFNVEEGGDLLFMEHTSKPFQEKTSIHKNRNISLF